jgi:prepilin-type N-terminal cleavage/methylation domain-containing protein
MVAMLKKVAWGMTPTCGKLSDQERLVHRALAVRRSRHSFNRGFTIIELVVVVVALGFILGIAIPAFQGVRLGMALSAAQRDVLAVVQNVRWRAINSALPILSACLVPAAWV